MREIKFRGETESGNLVFGGISPFGEIIVNDSNGNFRAIPARNVSQFTGYVDCNQREIYENDLVRLMVSRQIDGQCHFFVAMYRVSMFPYAHLETTVDNESRQVPISEIDNPNIVCEIVNK